MTDDHQLLELDLLTWSPTASPGPRPAAKGRFFAGGVSPEQALVAVANERLVGYCRLVPPTPLPSGAHVLEIQGLAVHPDLRRSGIARALLTAVTEHANARGVTKLSLRVLAGNAPAQALYRSAGFHVEGVLHREFRLEGRWVDDVLMARWVDQPSSL